jgi:hypothetical protein
MHVVTVGHRRKIEQPAGCSTKSWRRGSTSVSEAKVEDSHLAQSRSEARRIENLVGVFGLNPVKKGGKSGVRSFSQQGEGSMRRVKQEVCKESSSFLRAIPTGQEADSGEVYHPLHDVKLCSVLGRLFPRPWPITAYTHRGDTPWKPQDAALPSWFQPKPWLHGFGRKRMLSSVSLLPFGPGCVCSLRELCQVHT